MKLSSDIIQKIELFRGLPTGEIEKILSVSKNVKVARGDTIVKEGDAGNALYIIESGSVVVTKGAEILAIMDRGEIFGEMALIDNSPRSATVTALEEASLLVIQRGALEKYLAQNPGHAAIIYKNFASILAHRLRNLGGKMQTLAGEAEKIRASVGNMSSEIISILSHELRTPVAVIQGAADTLEGAVLDAEKQKKLIGHINRHTHRITRLMDDIVQMAEMKFGGADINRELHDVDKIIAEIAGELSDAAKERSVRVEISRAETLPEIPVDYTKIKKALFHLIENGIKFNREGGKLFIATEFDCDGKRALISISDEGPGIPPEMADSIAACFHQGKGSMDTNRAAGLGLGLPIACSIVRAHGGEIEFESPPQGGLRVKVKLLCN